MRAFHGRPSELPWDEYALADRLHVLPEQIRQMPHLDYMRLAAMYRVEGVLNKMRHEHAAKKR